ncbi:hypothetical protein FALCPG4_018606 [Fusarium falciforme]
MNGSRKRGRGGQLSFVAPISGIGTPICLWNWNDGRKIAIMMTFYYRAVDPSKSGTTANQQVDLEARTAGVGRGFSFKSDGRCQPPHTTVSSSILEYRKIQGRTHRSSNSTDYWTPNDDGHVEAFDVAHEWLTMMLDDKLYKPPIGDNPQRILDIGTGTGIWAMSVTSHRSSNSTNNPRKRYS